MAPLLSPQSPGPHPAATNGQYSLAVPGLRGGEQGAGWEVWAGGSREGSAVVSLLADPVPGSPSGEVQELTFGVLALCFCGAEPEFSSQ